MKVTLLPSWELTTEHAASSHGQPVFVNRADNQAYGPADVLEPYPSWGWVTGAMAVKRMAARRKFTDDERAFVARFIDLGKRGGQ